MFLIHCQLVSQGYMEIPCSVKERLTLQLSQLYHLKRALC